VHVIRPGRGNRKPRIVVLHEARQKRIARLHVGDPGKPQLRLEVARNLPSANAFACIDRRFMPPYYARQGRTWRIRAQNMDASLSCVVSDASEVELGHAHPPCPCWHKSRMWGRETGAQFDCIVP
jgi:hypothetical protein